ncbi:AAA family ATPase [Halosimplex litoreum]|uniref:AAA family ATPase n=1 Tax=Halosimplex litoreum TaxID=1198301 RepID=A0A7T3KTX1_9EURY|nr:AAA family ATPase [Halosimplex litoreum]QPV61378.1 AAA family ATPase [Halosimplex litoreum]
MNGTRGGEIYAVVGGVGGAGATRLSVEFAATLARAGRDVAVVDAAFSTQGLAAFVPERIEPDVTRVLTDDRPLAAAETRLGLDVPGSVTVAPARTPFERLARAKTSECARRLAERLSAATERYDAVFVDVPPVGANQSVAAVTAADAVALVVPDAERGSDAVPRLCDRLADVDAAVDTVVANRVDGDPTVEAADAVVPVGETESLSDAPAAVEPTAFAVAVASTVETLTGADLDLPEPESSSMRDYLPG